MFVCSYGAVYYGGNTKYTISDVENKGLQSAINPLLVPVPRSTKTGAGDRIKRQTIPFYFSKKIKKRPPFVFERPRQTGSWRYMRESFLPPPPLSDGTHFFSKRAVSFNEYHSRPGHAERMSCLQCEFPNILLESMPPDSELVDLIELAFIEGQIDSEKADLAYPLIRQMSAISTRGIN